MHSTRRILILLISASALLACAGQTSLSPQGDGSFRVIAQDKSAEKATDSANKEAKSTCEKTDQKVSILSQRTGVIDSTEAGGTEYRIVLHFSCIDGTP